MLFYETVSEREKERERERKRERERERERGGRELKVEKEIDGEGIDINRKTGRQIDKYKNIE